MRRTTFVVLVERKRSICYLKNLKVAIKNFQKSEHDNAVKLNLDYCSYFCITACAVTSVALNHFPKDLQSLYSLCIFGTNPFLRCHNLVQIKRNKKCMI